MINILCISRFYKGNDFMICAKEQGANVYLLTSSKLKDEPWAFDHITQVYYMPEDKNGEWDMENLINGLSYTMRTLRFDILVSLDDFDVENTAHLREYFRIDGMGETTAKHFRDKLAMRMKAEEQGIPVPEFSALFHDDDINHFADTVPVPWLLKPRSQASATGITKVHSKKELWKAIDALGDKRHQYLVERFTPGDVFHVDALTYDYKVVFAKSSRYLNTPFEVAHGGGIFRSQTLENNSKDAKAIIQMNENIITCFGMRYSASHTEFIKSQNGEYFFLETSSRVGGANLAEMVQAATGINLWAEWAKIEIASHFDKKYKLPKVEKSHAGIIASLSRFEKPDLKKFKDKEIWWKLDKKHHFGMIFKSDNMAKINDLLEKYVKVVQTDYHASLPAPTRPKS